MNGVRLVTAHLMAMPEITDGDEKAKGILRAEMARRGTTYTQLV